MSEEKGQGDKVVYPAGGEKPALKPTYQGIQKIFLGAEHERHREHAEEVLSKLILKEIYPLEGDGFLDYAQDYDDFSLLIEWWDFNDRGEFIWDGTLQYFLKYYDANGRYLTDNELSHQINEVRKDLLARMKEREQWGKEVQKRLKQMEEETDE